MRNQCVPRFRKGGHPLIAVVATFLCLQLTFGSAARALTLSKEKELGHKYLEIIRQHFHLVRDEEIVSYVTSVGDRIVAQLGPTTYHYRFFIINDNTPNAFTIPGGYVFLFRGLIELMSSEAELASIICHELAHSQAHHIEKQMQKSKMLNIASVAGMLAAVFLGLNGQATSALTTGIQAGAQSLRLKFSRENEEEADRLGLRYLMAAGYPPQAMVDVMRKMKQHLWGMDSRVPSYLLTHPGLNERIGYMSQVIAQLQSRHVRIRLRPPVGDFLMMQAALISQYADPDAAGAQLRIWSRRSGRKAASYYGLGRLALRIGHVEEALAQLKKAAALEPQSPMVLCAMGLVYLRLGELEQAKAVLQTALVLDPSSAVAHYRLAQVYQDLGDFRAALEQLKRARGLTLIMPELNYQFGVIYGKLNRLGIAHFYLGQYYRERREYKTATFHYRKAKELLPAGDPHRKEIAPALEAIDKARKE